MGRWQTLCDGLEAESPGTKRILRIAFKSGVVEMRVQPCDAKYIIRDPETLMPMGDPVNCGKAVIMLPVEELGCSWKSDPAAMN